MLSTEQTKPYELPVGTLARFAIGLGWRAIKDLDRTHRPMWWRRAVADSEERGLLEWDRASRRWRLTSAGRVAVRDVT